MVYQQPVSSDVAVTRAFDNTEEVWKTKISNTLSNPANVVVVKPLDNAYQVVTIDLNTARSDTSLTLAGNTITFFTKGTGTFSFKFNSSSNDSISNTDITDGDRFEFEFTDIVFTNTSQPAVTNPKIFISRRV